MSGLEWEEEREHRGLGSPSHKFKKASACWFSVGGKRSVSERPNAGRSGVDPLDRSEATFTSAPPNIPSTSGFQMCVDNSSVQRVQGHLLVPLKG